MLDWAGAAIVGFMGTLPAGVLVMMIQISRENRIKSEERARLANEYAVMFARDMRKAIDDAEAYAEKNSGFFESEESKRSRKEERLKELEAEIFAGYQRQLQAIGYTITDPSSPPLRLQTGQDRMWWIVVLRVLRIVKRASHLRKKMLARNRETT